MQTKNVYASALCAGILSLGLATSWAQTTANYIGPTSGGEWNTAANWDTGLPPGADANGTTNAWIGQSTNVSYNLPMSAAGFGNLTNYGVLNINTNGFNCSAIYVINPNGGDKLFLTNSGTIVNVNGALTMGTNATALLSGGAQLTVGSLVLDANTSSHAGGTSALTNNGGFLVANNTTVNNNQGTGTGLLLINGGTNLLGNTAVGRNNSGAGGVALGLEGLVINNGLVIMTNLNLGNNGSGLSSLSSYISGGVVTNMGSVFINQGSSARFSRLVQSGGLFVVPDPGVVNPNPTVSGSFNNYVITGGTNIVGGFFLGNSNGSPGTINFTNAATIYVGSQGINWNGAATLNVTLNNGGLFGASTSWSGLVPMKLNSGTFTFQAADQAGNAQDISLSGVLSGSGSLTKTGNGTLTLSAAETYTGNTVILGGTLAVGAGGSLTSSRIVVGNGTTFDVSQSGSLTLGASQTLAGFGTVAGQVLAGNSSTIYPGSNSVTGTLTFSSTLTENGGVNNEFNLSGNPSGPGNDLLNVPGGLTVSGANNIIINGALQNGGVYPLINYSGGTFNGDIASFSVSGATGTLSNSATAQIIYFIAQSSVRNPTNITWIGNPVANNWDTELTTNWLNNGTGNLDFFVPNDNVLFSNLGASNSMVNISGTVSPGSVTINTTSNYVFTGNGAIGGAGTFAVSNGLVTVLTTNTYTGPTILDGGALITPIIANSGSPSGIGAATDDPGNLIFNGGTLAYSGAAVSTDHGLTLTNLGGTIDVTNGTALTIAGDVIGDGTLTVVDTGKLILANANSYTNMTTIAGGVLQLNNANGAGTGDIMFSNGTLVYYPSGGITVANPLNFDSGTTNVIVVTSGSGGNPIGGGNWTGSGLIVVSNTFNPYTVNGVLDGVTGTILLGTPNGAGLRFNSGGGNSCFGSTNATFDLGTGTATLLCRNAGTMNLGALSGASGTFLQGQDADTGTVIWAIGYNNLSTIFAGIIEDNAQAANRVAAITKLGTGTLTLSGQSTYTGTTTVSNGVLALAFNPTNGSDGSISQSAQVNILPGTFLDVSGRSDGTFPLNSAQQLRGRGTINGILDTTGGGMVAPGGGPGGSTGAISVTNNINLGGTAWMKLNRASTPNSDQLVSTLSTISYGGTLVVTNIGAKLQPGDTFTLFHGGGLSVGSFGNVILPNYYTWDTSKLGVNGSITVTAILPPPSLTNVDFSTLSSGTITLNAVNGAPNGPVTVLTTTNLALPTSSWTTVTTTTFDSNGNLNLPITVDPTLPQSYFLLQTF